MKEKWHNTLMYISTCRLISFILLFLFHFFYEFYWAPRDSTWGRAWIDGGISKWTAEQALMGEGERGDMHCVQLHIS